MTVNLYFDITPKSAAAGVKRSFAEAKEIYVFKITANAKPWLFNALL